MPSTPDGSRRPAPAELLADPNPGLLRGSLHLVYDLSWWVAGLFGFPWLLWRMARDRAFRAMVVERMGRGLERLPAPDRPRVLVHGVSVGEAKAALPIVRAIERAHPELEVVISTTTNTGLEVARGLFPRNRIVRFPVDPTFVVRRFLDRVAPSLVLLVELEIWPNFLRLCNRGGIPVAVVNGRITEMSHGQYLLFRDVLPQFNRISLFCVQLEEYANRFRRLHVEEERLLVTGNVKVDGLAIGRVDAGEELTRLIGGRDGAPVVVAGSTHEPEELLLAEAWRTHAPQARLVLVPRHPHRAESLVETLAARGFEARRLSDLRRTHDAVRSDEVAPGCVVIVDSIGELERIYGLADLVFVGGSLIEHGGHNMLEPAAQGRATLFGPHVTNFAQEAAILRAEGGCRQLAGVAELGPVMAELLRDDAERARMGAAAVRAVDSQRGATAKTLAALDALSLARIVTSARRSREAGGPRGTVPPALVDAPERG